MTVTYRLRYGRDRNWHMTVYANGQDITSVAFANQRPSPKRCEAVAQAAAVRTFGLIEASRATVLAE